MDSTAINSTHFLAILLASFLIVGGVLFALLRVFTARILAAVDRIPVEKWFTDVDERLPSKEFIERMSAAIDRIPSQDFLDRMARAIERIPSEDFLRRSFDHFKQGHEHANNLTKHEYRIASLEKEVSDLRRQIGERRAGA